MKKYLKQVLLLLLLALCIISLKENKTYAFTYEQFVDYCYGIQKFNIGNQSKTLAQWITTNEQTIKNYIDDPTEYTTWYCDTSSQFNAGSFTTYTRQLLLCFKGGDNLNWTGKPKISNYTKLYIVIKETEQPRTGSPTTTWYYGTANQINYYSYLTTNTYIGLCSIPGINYSGKYWNNYYLTINMETPIKINPYMLPQDIGTITLGESLYNTETKIILSEIDGTQIKEIPIRYAGDNNIGLWTLYLMLDSIDGITNKKQYILTGYQNGVERFETSNISFEWEPQTSAMTNASGEYIGGIDLTTTNVLINIVGNKIDNNTEAIIQGNSAIINTLNSGNQEIINKLEEQESGEKARFNYWQGIYNGLFTLTSGDVFSLKDKLSNILNLEDNSEYAEEMNFFEELQDVQPSDFIIEWTSFRYQNVELWQPGSINFSLQARTNTTLNRVHSLIRIICTGAISILIVKELWRITCILLGIGTEIYDKGEDENEIIENTSYETTGDFNDNVTRRVYTRRDRKGNRTRLTGKGINITRG